MSNKKIEFANTLRGLAAIFVLLGHYFHKTWEMRPLIESFANVLLPSEAVLPTPYYIKLLDINPAFDWGAYGVAIFFLISGLVIPLSLKRYSTSAFLVGRIFRIWPVYAVGFTISASSIYLASLYFGKPFQYTASHVAIHYLLGLRDLLWSPGIDGIIWTLEIEIKFYLICALIAPLIRHNSLYTFAVPVFIAACCFAVTGYMKDTNSLLRTWQLTYMLSLAGQFIVFMFVGTTFAYWREGRLSTTLAVLISLLLLSLFFSLSVWGPHKTLAMHPVAYVAAVITFLLFAAFNRRTSKFMSFLSGISYPLYVSHGAMGYVIIAIALNRGASPKVALFAASLVAIAVSYFLHVGVETPTHRLGQKISRNMTARRRDSFPGPSI